MRITVHDDASAFLDLARGPLLELEAANGLLLGVALRLVEGSDESRPTPYMATVGGHVGHAEPTGDDCDLPIGKGFQFATIQP